MRFIHSWSYAFANYLMIQLKENHEKRRVFYFGFQIVIGALVKGTLLVLISLIFGTIKPTLVILLSFAALRTIAGGYHMDTYGKCIATSLLLFIASGLIAQYTYNYWQIYYISVFTGSAFVIALWVLYKWAPSDTPNRPITEPEEIHMFKRRSLMYAFMGIILEGILIWNGMYLYSLALTFGVLLEVFTITPLGYKFFDKISGKSLQMEKHG